MKLFRNIKKLGNTFSGVEKVVDKEYDVLEKQFKQQKNRIGKIQKNMKSMVDHLDGFSNNLSSLMRDLSIGYPEQSPMKVQFANLEQEASALSEQIKFYKQNLVSKCQDKFSEFSRECKAVEKTMGKREDAKTDYEKLRNDVKKLEQKVQDDPNILPKKKDELKWTSKSYNENVKKAKHDMKAVITNSPVYLEPTAKVMCEESFKFSQNMEKYFKKMYEITQKMKVSENKKQPIQSQELPPPPPKGANPKKKSEKERLIKQFSVTEWYYLDENIKQIGPFNFHQLRDLFRKKKINPTTHVFGGNLKDWQEISGVNGMLEAIK